jgi:hypothetical protein
VSAVLSSCGRYRYRLNRTIQLPPGGVVVGRQAAQATVVMLNPSTADAAKDDPTIRKLRGFCRVWQCGELAVVNLFAFRATDPLELAKLEGDEEVGPDNDRHIAEAIAEADLLVFAWGNGRGPIVKRMIAARVEKLAVLRAPGALRLGELTSGGNPRHPLYTPFDTPLVNAF